MNDRSRPTTTRLPLVVRLLAVLGVAFVALPLVGLLWRVPWSRVGEVLGDDATLTALRLSLVCSLGATALAAALGIPLAWLLARVPFRGSSVVRALATLSMVLPPVVGGVALFAALGRRGLVGQYLDSWFGVRLPFTTAGAMVAQAFVAMPFLVVALEAALRQVDTRYEDAARTLGASPGRVFLRVTLPSVRPALVAGLVLAWARALGEFGATITFAGNFPGTTQTLPLAVYLALENDSGAGLVLAALMMAVSLAVLVVLRGRWIGRGPLAGGTP